VLFLLATVIVVDQAAKWWAWRHVAGAHINPGGDFLTGPTVGGWYAQPVPGALLDLLDVGLVSFAVTILARRRRLTAVTVCGALMVGGWGSNLLDRLGMHYWTAPGSIRGAVDFINTGGHCYNLADFIIVGATTVFLLAAAGLTRRAASRPAAAAAPAACSWPRAPVIALAVAGLVITVALGAAYNGRLLRPSPTSVAAASQRIHVIAGQPAPVKASVAPQPLPAVAAAHYGGVTVEGAEGDGALEAADGLGVGPADDGLSEGVTAEGDGLGLDGVMPGVGDRLARGALGEGAGGCERRGVGALLEGGWTALVGAAGRTSR
jgi:lipoprotein signal peptidase